MSAVAGEPRAGADNQRLCCEFCWEAEFEAHEEKVEHERNCDAARVTVRLPRQPKKSIGLSICYGAARQTVSQASAVFQYVNEIRAVATALFPSALNDWENMADKTLDEVMDFGRKYMRQHHHRVEPFNEGTLKAAFRLLLKPGDVLESVQYTHRTGMHARGRAKKERLWLPSDVSTLMGIFPCDDSCPMDLFIKRIPSAGQATSNFNPLQATQTLDLRDNILVRSDFRGLIDRLCQFRSLRELDLEKNGLGRNECRTLMALLREGSPLEWLSLKQNAIDDDCVHMFVEALEQNTTLTNLYLNKNDGITGRGQDELLDLIGDGPTIDHTYLSNDTIRCLSWDCTDSDYYDAADVPPHLKTLLGINRSRNEYDPGRQKVWYRYFCGNRLDLEPLLDMGIAVVPHLLAWITMVYDSEGERRFRAQFSKEEEHLEHVHRFVRDWNVPALFGFLSADKLRILELEELVKTLKARISELVKENDELREENCALKGEGTDSLKRKRGN